MILSGLPRLLNLERVLHGGLQDLQVGGGSPIHGAGSLPAPSPATEAALPCPDLHCTPACRESTGLAPWKACLGLVNMPNGRLSKPRRREQNKPGHTTEKTGLGLDTVL